MANQVTVSVEGEERILSLLEQLPVLVRASGGPLDKAVKKAANIVAVKARQLAPDGEKGERTRDKQSKKTKAKWTGKLKRTIRVKLVKYERASWAIVGPKSPEGNMAHFNQEKPRRNVLWGKATAIKQIRIERNWITKAFDDTKQQQLTAMESSLKSDIDANMRGEA